MLKLVSRDGLRIIRKANANSFFIGISFALNLRRDMGCEARSRDNPSNLSVGMMSRIIRKAYDSMSFAGVCFALILRRDMGCEARSRDNPRTCHIPITYITTAEFFIPSPSPPLPHTTDVCLDFLSVFLRKIKVTPASISESPFEKLDNLNKRMSRRVQFFFITQER